MTDTMSNQQFSEKDHAEIYNVFRPDIPAEIGSNIVSHLKEKYDGSLSLALDVGCGSGQSTIILAPYFNQVVGIDVSEAQIDEAAKSRLIPNVSFKSGPAEVLPFPDASVQLVTACAALHWFQAERFFSEVKRVLSPNGVFAAYTYHFIKPSSEDPICIEKIDNLFAEKYKELYPYFSQHVFSSLDMYKDVCFPFDEVQRASDVRQTFNGRITDVTGFIETLSGFQNMKRENADKAERYMSDFSQRLKEILLPDLGGEDKILTLYRDFYIVLCRKSK